MARKEQVTCDVCGAQKQVSNHWFVATPYKGGLFVQRAGGDLMSTEGIVDLCGEGCVLKKVAEFTSK